MKLKVCCGLVWWRSVFGAGWGGFRASCHPCGDPWAGDAAAEAGDPAVQRLHSQPAAATAGLNIFIHC